MNHATDSFLNRRSACAPRGRRGYAPATALVAVALLALAGCGGPFRPAPPKGILVILVDALRADQLQLYGSKVAIAPRLDALGPESVVFERAFSPASWTRPALPSLFTGLYPSEHGLTDFVGSAGQYKGAVLSESALTLAEEMKAAGRRTAMVGYQTLLSARFGMAQGFDFYNNNTNGGERIRKRFLEWFDEAPGQPFFAYLHYLDIHWPYCPPAPTWGRVDPTPNETITCDDWRGLRERIRSGQTVLTEADRRALAARYSEEMMALDWELGALFDELKRRGAWDDLLIVVTADHGEELAERGGIEHGHTLYDELLHVPYIWKLPLAWDGGRGRRESGLVETRTLMPTLVDVVGGAAGRRVRDQPAALARAAAEAGAARDLGRRRIERDLRGAHGHPQTGGHPRGEEGRALRPGRRPARAPRPRAGAAARARRAPGTDAQVARGVAADRDRRHRARRRDHRRAEGPRVPLRLPALRRVDPTGPPPAARRRLRARAGRAPAPGSARRRREPG